MRVHVLPQLDGSLESVKTRLDVWSARGGVYRSRPDAITPALVAGLRDEVDRLGQLTSPGCEHCPDPDGAVAQADTLLANIGARIDHLAASA